MTRQPRDHEVRERIRTARGETFLVDAGAGTGKTTALVGRITELVRAGEPVASLAAITFTEAAATELRHRVRASLEAASADDPSDARVRDALAGVDDGTFTTLHAFALRLLREHSVEAGLPPELVLMTTVEEEIELDRRWEGFLDSLFDEPAFQRLIGRLHRLSISPTGLRDVAEKLHQDQDRIAELGEPPAELPDPDVTRVEQALAEVRRVRERCTDPGDTLASHLDRVLWPWAEAIAGMHGEQLLGELLSPPRTRPTKKSGSKTSWPGCKDDVHAAIDELDDALEAVRQEQAEALARVLAAHLGRFVADWSRDRRRRGHLVFADLLVLARDLLRDHVDVRRSVRDRYRFILIDEFQDTDPIQYELALLIGTDPDGPDRIEPGRLFVVGDPKQSIYSFRRADLGIYAQARARTDDLRTLDLVENFRSRPELIEWVNAVFSRLMVESPGSQPAYVPLEPHREPAPDGAGVAWFGGAHRDLRAAEVRVAEADDAARVISGLLADGTPASDVAVLVRRHGTVRLLERSLTDVGVPYRIESRSLIHQTDEVRGLVAILSVLADPEDEIALVASLRSAALGCSDRDLVDHRHAGGRWSLYAAAPAGLVPDQPVAAAMDRLRALIDATHGLPLGQIVETVIAELGLRELAYAHRRPRDRWRRLAFVVDQARAFADAGGHLRGFIRHMLREAEQGVRVDEHVVPEEDDASVRITTVHGAKGLEYPVVVLLGLDQALDRPPGHLRVAWGDAGTPPELSLHAELRTPGFGAANTAHRARHDHEETRLLYVAATRARERLVVSRHHRAGVDCHAARLEAIAPDLGELWSSIDPALTTAPATVAAVPTVAPAEIAEAREDEETFVVARERILRRAAWPTAVAATGAGVLDPVAVDDGDWVISAAPGDDRRLASHGPAVGRAVHRTLQDVRLDADPHGDEVTRLSLRSAVREGVPDAASDIAALVANCLRSDVVRSAVRAAEVHRELYVGVPAVLGDGSTVVLEGVIDLLFRDDDGWVIVDHKTDVGALGSPREVAASHRAQLGVYAAALTRLLGPGARLDRAVLLFARDGSTATIDGSLLDADPTALLVEPTA